MNNRIFSRFLAILFPVLTIYTGILIASFGVVSIIDNNSYDIGTLSKIIFIFFGVTLIIYGGYRFSRRTQHLIPHNVAIIGFPRSGKTTLIVTLFQEIFSRKISGIKATLKGESTIDRLNEQIEKKQSGLAIGPTNDQTMFAYRTNIEVGKGFNSREYKVEFGDYPGEYSEKLSDSEYYNDLKKTEFFKWCIEADAYIFIVDVGKYFMANDSKKFVAATSKTIRQSWQHFVDNSYGRESKIKRKPVILIFNKMDLCSLIKQKNDNNTHLNPEKHEQYCHLVKNIAFSNYKLPPDHDIEINSYNMLQDELTDRFHDLIIYLKSECQRFSILYTSSFGEIRDKYADVDKILKLVFPY